MELKNFQVLNFRCINDSGVIEVNARTALAGRNESGKTNLLLALRSLNPLDGLKDLSYVKDFPRREHNSKFDGSQLVVKTIWRLNTEEQTELTALFPRAKGVSELGINRPYKAIRYIEFKGISLLKINRERVEKQLKSFERNIKNLLKERKDKAVIEKAGRALNVFSHEISTGISEPAAWARRALKVLGSFRQSLAALKFELSENAAKQLQALEEQAQEASMDESLHARAVAWVTKKLPVFIYLNDYPQLNGHQSIKSFIQHQEKGQLTETERNFARLCKVAELEPALLAKLLTTDPQQRQLMTNRAGAIITKKIRTLWMDRPLKIRFNLDAEHFDTLVSEPGDIYDIEVNLNERSRGFRWFFSFYVTFAADTAGGSAKHAILLLDEPGLFLHATSQQDLLLHFATDFYNSIIYTSHSPFMMPQGDLAAIRTVNTDPEKGTWVSNRPAGDAKTLMPLQAALSYDLGEALFAEQATLVVEHISDFWYLSAVSDYLAPQNGLGLPDGLTVTPAGGAHKIAYLTALLAAWRANKVLVLLSGNQAVAARQLTQTRLVDVEGLVYLDAAFTDPPHPENALEDLLEPEVFDKLVKAAYASDLENCSLNVNPDTSGIVQRYADAFKPLRLTFRKSRPAQIFVQNMAKDPEAMLPSASLERFEKLFQAVARSYTKVLNLASTESDRIL